MFGFGSYFKANQEVQDAKALESMKNELQKIGGPLHFTVEKHSDGWTAECQEIQGIITGGDNPEPTEEEIKDNIREAIHVAFNVETATNRAPSKVYNSNEIGALYSVAGERSFAI